MLCTEHGNYAIVGSAILIPRDHLGSRRVCKGRGTHFSHVLGALSTKSSMTILPTGSVPICTSRNTRGYTVAPVAIEKMLVFHSEYDRST